MPLNIRNKETVALAREVAARTGRTVTRTIHEALLKESLTLPPTSVESDRRADLIQEIQDRIARVPKTGLKADKAFFDSLYDE